MLALGFLEYSGLAGRKERICGGGSGTFHSILNIGGAEGIVGPKNINVIGTSC